VILNKFETFRLLGARVYEVNYKAIVYKAIMKIYMENYLDTLIMTILQYYGWVNYPNGDFWAFPTGFLQQISTIIHLILMIVFPLTGGIKIWMNHDSLDKTETLKRYGVFYDETLTKTRAQAMFNVFAMLRRFILILTIIQI